MAVPMLVLHSFRASPCSSSWVFSVFCVVKVLSDLGILDDDPPFCAVNSLDFPSLPSSTVSLRSILSILYVVTSVHERSGCLCTSPRGCNRTRIASRPACSASCTSNIATALSSSSLRKDVEEELGLGNGVCSSADESRQACCLRVGSNHVDVDANGSGQLPAVCVDASAL